MPEKFASEPVRLGILGGTFDPPHYGHLFLAQMALAQLRLARVLWVLTAEPPHKADRRLAAVADRLDMVLAAIEGCPAYELSRVDLDRPGPHWAADSVALLARQFPAAALIYLMGSDSLNNLPGWYRAHEFLAYVSLGVMRRPGDNFDLAALERVFPGVASKVFFIQAAPRPVASRDVRRRVRLGEAPDDLVPDAVAAIIRQRGLYKDD